MKFTFVSLLLSVIMCDNVAVIKQEVEMCHICPYEAKSETIVWVLTWDGIPISIEWSQYKTFSSPYDANAASAVQLENAKLYLKKVADCLSENDIKVSPKTFVQQPLKVPACSLQPKCK